MALGERPGKGTEVTEQGGLANDGVGGGRNLQAGPGRLWAQAAALNGTSKSFLAGAAQGEWHQGAFHMPITMSTTQDPGGSLPLPAPVTVSSLFLPGGSIHDPHISGIAPAPGSIRSPFLPGGSILDRHISGIAPRVVFCVSSVPQWFSFLIIFFFSKSMMFLRLIYIIAYFRTSFLFVIE